MNSWNFEISKVLQVLCVCVAFPTVFEKFLEASGDKRMNASDRSLRNSMLLLTDRVP